MPRAGISVPDSSTPTCISFWTPDPTPGGPTFEAMIPSGWRRPGKMPGWRSRRASRPCGDCAAPGRLMSRFQCQVDAGEVAGPHIVSCGYALMRPKGHCHFLGGEVANVREACQRIEWNLNHGAGFVKLMASGGGLTPGTVPHEADLPLEIMKAAVREAHANGVHITAHCHATDSIRRGIQAGLDMIEHASFVEPPGRYRYDEDLTRQVRDAGIIVGPTVYSALQTARRFRAAGCGPTIPATWRP